MRKEHASFAAGCFWGVEEAFRYLDGALDAESGYMGGTKENPTYEDVCSHSTGHAETVRVTFDPEQLSYEKLPDVFFDIHDSTHVNRQGPDKGEQYRTEIFVTDGTQRELVEKVIEALEKSEKYDKLIATRVTDAPRFWRAEEYHQYYLEKHPGAPCSRSEKVCETLKTIHSAPFGE